MAKSAVKKRLNIWPDRERPTPASSFSLLSRLVGIETEYGLYLGKIKSPETEHNFSAFDIFDRLVPWLKKRLPVASSSRDLYRVFLANGACIGVETSANHRDRSGLIEVATPECRSPLELIAYQTVLDGWMIDSLRELHPESDARWLKNSSDAQGVTYGQHENYEVRIASGWRLMMWRIGLLVMLPMLGLYRTLAAVATIFFMACSKPFIVRLKSSRDLESVQIKGTKGSSEHLFHSKVEPWMLPLARGLRWIHWPVAIYFHGLVWMFAMVPHRRWMGAFLASRSIIEGSGHIDRRGRFWLSARASQINSEIGFGRYWNESPMFMTGHWLRNLLADRTWSFRAWREMFNPRQRIQIALGDSTPNERAQYLRVSTTSLVFDLVESGRTFHLPRLKSVLRSLKAIATDGSLLRTVGDRRGVVWTAIDLQRQYAEAARLMISQLQSSTPVSRTEEAKNSLAVWQETLDRLQESENDTRAQKWLLGRVDWFSKRWLMDRSVPQASWAMLKKIDLKFHEMDSRGYFRQLIRALDIPQMIDSVELDRASRMPPSNSPAIRRAYLIREFADHYDDFLVDWNEVVWTDEHGVLVRVPCL